MTDIPVKMRLLNERAAAPEFARTGDAGYDLRAAEHAYLLPGQTLAVGTGIAIEIPGGTVALVCSRSGLAAKHSVAVLNAPGVVDSGYRGEVKVLLHNHGIDSFQVQPGDRIAQLLFQEYLAPVFEVVDELASSDRGDRGFGSSGVTAVIA